MLNRLALLAVFVPVAAPSIVAQTPPQVESLEPANEAADIDPQQVTELIIRFDQAMTVGAQSFIGGGPTFPQNKGVRWQNPRTCIMSVELAPGRTYHLGLNNQRFQGFRNKDGVVLEPVQWSFTTLPAELRSKQAQRKINKAAFAELRKVLESKYWYLDHHGVNWRKLYKQHEKTIHGSRSDLGWASAVGKMLRPLGDIHLYLRLGETTVGTGRRRVDPMIRPNLLPRYIDTFEKSAEHLWSGHTADGIGYIMVGEFTDNVDFDAVEQLIAMHRQREALIVDVRLNSGGQENLARRVAQWFVDGEKVYAKNDYRTGKGKQGFGQVHSRTIEGKPDDERFAGKTVVLMSKYCMSSCEAFILMMKQAEDCTLIGQPSYGSSGNPKPHELPNGVRLFAPSWRAMRPDGSIFEGEGIAPDIEVEAAPADFEQRDPYLETALEHLRAG